ncbi:hypothetical protein HR45_00125 [Shewanella mangrovi]|uniref:HTH marR-type domain-containing protein n=1 Tax=Shewanella mangrovi TaxID=1515746 RepID=A0A094JG11_9GAMM|nr:MarR family winged helix-turn-helix transcriptional regulator [Shewanella mangrovi]KFZ38850.1 hypothetical protein HR45_00125 [Shewanella mangrovi]
MAQQSVGYLMVDILRLLRREFQTHELATDIGITLAQARALKCVAMHPGIRQVEVAELMEIKPMSLVPVLDHLVALSLLERRKDPNDRRAHGLFITEKGNGQLIEIKAIVDDIWDAAASGLAETDIAIFKHVLETLHSNLSLKK